MSFRFNENDVSTSGADKILVLDETGKIPALDGSNITNIAASGYNGLSYSYTTDNTTNIDASIDKFYYIPQANRKVSAGGNIVNINIPYSSNIINGSKVGFEYITTGGSIAGGQYTITTPSNASLAAQGWTSFELFIDGVSYSNGAVFTSEQGANRTRHLYAYVNGTDLKWFDIRGGLKSLSEITTNFDLNNTNPYVEGRTYTIATKFDSSYSSSLGNVNVENYGAKQFNTTLATPVTINLGTNMPSTRRSFFITNQYTTSSSDWGNVTLPAVTTTEGVLYHIHMGLIFGTSSTRFNTLQITSPSNFRWHGPALATAFSSSVLFGNTTQHGDYIIVSDGANYYFGILERY